MSMVRRVLQVQPDAFLGAIRRGLDGPLTTSAFLLGDKPGWRFVGSVKERSFVVRPARFPANANTPLMRGEVLDAEGGCEVVTTVGVHPMTRVGLVVLIGLAVLLTTLGVLAGLRNPIFFFFALAMLAIFVVLASGTRSQARRDSRKLSEFIDRAAAQGTPRAPRAVLSEPELRKRFEAHRIDQFHKQAQLTAAQAVIHLGEFLRLDARERLDAYKWVAAISTAGFFFVGQALGAGALPIRAESVWGLLAAECGFLVSIAAAGGYMFRVDRRIAEWSRRMASYSDHTQTLLAGMEASAAVLQDALNATDGKPDLEAANTAFWETYDSKEEMGKHLSSQNPGMPPREGRSGALLSSFCVGGLGFGVLAAAGHWLSRLTW